MAQATFEPAEIQDLADVVPKLLDIKAKSKVPIAFQVRLEIGDDGQSPPAAVVQQLNEVLATVKDGFQAI